MTPGKRLFDLALALPLALLLLPVMLGIALLVRLRDGAPVLHVSPRMATAERAFGLLKFRTMRPLSGDRGVTGPEKRDRITATGRWLRTTRLDELPQLWNVIRGDISLVGPRPPLPCHVAGHPRLYGRVLRSRPGVTGLATVVFHAHEARLLARSASAEETEAIYARACIPRKARLDLLYQARRGLWLDMALLVCTVIPALRFFAWRKGAKRRRAAPVRSTGRTLPSVSDAPRSLHSFASSSPSPGTRHAVPPGSARPPPRAGAFGASTSGTSVGGLAG